MGQAVAETLFGQNNPGGKLPLTFVQTVGQIPMCIPHRKGAWGMQNRGTYENGWGASRAIDPLYYFGHGLSYTSFKYSGLKIEPANPAADQPISITCQVTNAGTRAGDEVVQLYITDLFASVTPFDQVLRGFERISLKPGETRNVSFILDPKRDLKMLNRKNEWVVEPGEFKVMISSSSAAEGIQQEGSVIVH